MSNDQTAKRQKLITESYAPPPHAILPSMDITDFREDPQERKWTKPFTFVLGADTQFGFIAWRAGPGSEVGVHFVGNHDLGDDFNRNTVKVYRRQFGQHYFSFWVGGAQFVVLNSQYIFAPERVPQETQNQWEFIDSISDQSAKHIVAFQHIPYFVESPDESDNLNQQIPKSQRFQYLEKLRDAGVRYIFCGHAHQNGGGTTRTSSRQSLELLEVLWVRIQAVTGL